MASRGADIDRHARIIAAWPRSTSSPRVRSRPGTALAVLARGAGRGTSRTWWTRCSRPATRACSKSWRRRTSSAGRWRSRRTSGSRCPTNPMSTAIGGRLRRHRRRQEPVHRLALAAGRPHGRQRGATARAAGARTSSTCAAPASSTTSASSASRTSSSTSRLARAPGIRGHPPPPGAHVADPRAGAVAGDRGRDGRQPPRASRRSRLFPRRDRAGAVDGGQDRGRRRRLRGADGGPAVPGGDADGTGARDAARVARGTTSPATSSRRSATPSPICSWRTSPGTRACHGRRSRR